MQVPLSKPDIIQKDIDAVTEVMKSGILSIGPRIEEFEKRMAGYVGTKYAVGVNSGTSGLHLLIKSFGIKKGDEVITTPFSFVASANCILYEGATPVFTDIHPENLCMDIDGIVKRITPKTKAILAVDVFGHPVNMAEIRRIADEYRLIFIEDSCESLGSEFEGIRTGKLADGAVFAFYPNKQITTAEGGMITTNNREIAELCRSYRSQGRAETGLWLHHQRLGYNYRLSEIHSALGLAQLERIDEIIEKRNRIADLYNSKLKDVCGVKIPFVDARVTRMSWFVYVIRLEYGIDRNRFMQHLLENGVGCKPYFTPVHLQPYFVEMFGYKKGDYPVTEQVSSSTAALPFYNDITEAEIDYVVEMVKQGIEKAG